MTLTSPAIEPDRRSGGCGCVGAILAAVGGSVGATVVLGFARDIQAGPQSESLLGRAIDVASVVVVCSLAGLAIVTGLRLISGSRDSASRTHLLFERQGGGLPILVFILALAAGQLALLGGSEIGLVLAHPLAAAMPALAVVGAIAVRQRGVEPAVVFRGLVWGAAIATLIAFIAEMFFLGVIGLLLYLGLRSSPEGLTVIESIRDIFQQFLNDPSMFEGADMAADVASLVLRPSFVLAAFALFGLFGPAIEELAKVAGVALIRPRNRARALLVGAACGAGFGAAEALLLGMAGLGPLWAVSMLVRVFSTLMHSLLSGVAGLGWYALSVERQWFPGVRGIAAAIVGHGAWNSLVLAAVFGGFASEYAEGKVALIGQAMAVMAPLGLVLLIAIFMRSLRTVATQVGAGDGVGRGQDYPEMLPGMEFEEAGSSAPIPALRSEDR